MMTEDKKKDLLKRTGEYMEDYLEDFTVRGINEDVVPSVAGMSIQPAEVRQFPGEVDYEDFHRKRFESCYGSLPEATLSQFIDAVSRIPNVVVIDIASEFGKDFGLHIAKRNDTAMVHVYNPRPIGGFAETMFDKLSAHESPLLEKKTQYNEYDPEGSALALYRQNLLYNIWFHKEAATQEILKQHARDRPFQRHIFYANKVYELVPMIVNATKASKKAEMIVLPFVNSELPDYRKDKIIDIMNRYYARLRAKNPHDTLEPSGLAETRLITMLNQYISLKMAVETGACVYRESDRKLGFPFNHPTHIVSTLKV